MNRFILSIAVLAACEDGTTDDTAETGTDTDTEVCTQTYGPDDPTLVQSFSVSCVSTEASISALLTGLSAANSAVIFMQETGSSYAGGQWSEEHDLDTIAFDECGFEEDLGQVIETLGTSTGSWAPGSASVFTCDDHINEPDWMTYAVYVEDIDDGVSDCLVLGGDPGGLIAGDYDADRVGAEPSFDLSACIAGVSTR
jgi:hypothetical protein